MLINIFGEFSMIGLTQKLLSLVQNCDQNTTEPNFKIFWVNWRKNDEVKRFLFFLVRGNLDRLIPAYLDYRINEYRDYLNDQSNPLFRENLPNLQIGEILLRQFNGQLSPVFNSISLSQSIKDKLIENRKYLLCVLLTYLDFKERLKNTEKSIESSARACAIISQKHNSSKLFTFDYPIGDINSLFKINDLENPPVCSKIPLTAQTVAVKAFSH